MTQPPGGGRRPSRMTLSKAEATHALGVIVDYLEDHVLPEVRTIRRGRRRLIPVAEIERWIEGTAH